MLIKITGTSDEAGATLDEQKTIPNMHPFSTAPESITEAFSIKSQVIIVTGAAGAIGSGIAKAFGINGARVVCSDRAGRQLDQVTEDFVAEGLDVLKQAADLNRPEDLRVLLQAAEEHYGRINAILNCGAIIHSDPIDEESDDEFDRIFHTNLRSAWLLIKHALEPFERAGGGAVVNIASINGHRAQSPCSLYAGSKAAMLRMTQELAVELADRNIRVNSISPGTIGSLLTRMQCRLQPEYGRSFHEKFMNSEVAKHLAPEMQALSMSGEPYDIAMAALYLCSPAARFVTGADILVDGGLQHAFTMSSRRIKERRSRGEAVREEVHEFLSSLPDEAWLDGKPKWLSR